MVRCRPRKMTDQQPGSILSTGSSGRRGHRVRSELVAETSAYGVDAGIDRRREANVFPLRTQEQTADQIDVDTKACGIAIDQMVMHAIRRTQWSQRGERPERREAHGVLDVYGARDVGIAERKPAERVRQETSVGVARASAERRHVRDRNRSRRRRRDVMKIAVR